MTRDGTTAGVRSRRQIKDGRLIVDGRRRLVLGAEVHNSSSSTPEAITESFARVAQLGATTVLAPVAWDLLEPVEGVFDFELVDCMVEVALRNSLLLVPLWFGSWKNGVSSYVPGWIKNDPQRFARAELATGTVETLSTFSEVNREADARAFTVLMRRLAEVDVGDLVELVQVENEVGLLGGCRDLGAPALAAWDEEVPPQVVGAVRGAPGTRGHMAWVAGGSRESGRWEEVFGRCPAADELFMATAYARYVEHVARRGAGELDVPLFVNAWQDSELDLGSSDASQTNSIGLAGGDGPGTFPSGGPVPDVVSVWRSLAPSISVCAPDIYAKDFDTVARKYRERAGALFIPEMQRSAKGVAQMFRAVGEYGAVGVSPFGADSFTDETESAPLRDAYRMLRGVAHVLEQAPGSETRGVLMTESQPTLGVQLAGLELEVSVVDPFGLNPPVFPAYAVLVAEEPGRLLVAARGCTITALALDGLAPGIVSAEEVDLDSDGVLRVVRRLNGDETASGSAVRFPPLDPIPPGPFPIPLWNRSTGLVRIRYYRVGDTTSNATARVSSEAQRVDR